MRVAFVPPSDRQWIQYYAHQQTGKGFIGSPYQRGNGLGSLFRGIFRFLLPVAKTAGRAIGKQALKTGAQVASDLVAGENFGAAVKKRSKSGASALMKSAAETLDRQKGTGIGNRKKAKCIKGAPKRTKRTRRVSRKKQQDQFGVYYK